MDTTRIDSDDACSLCGAYAQSRDSMTWLSDHTRDEELVCDLCAEGLVGKIDPPCPADCLVCRLDGMFAAVDRIRSQLALISAIDRLIEGSR